MWGNVWSVEVGWDGERGSEDDSMKYDVIYNKANGSLTKKSFTNMKDAFEWFWKRPGNGPMITSDKLMSAFSFRDIQGFKSREEGKKFAHLAFLEYVKDNKI